VNVTDGREEIPHGLESMHELHDSTVGDVFQIGSAGGNLQVTLSLPHYRTPRQVPAPPATFVDRTDDLSVLDGLLEDRRQSPQLAVLSGAPGIGKRTVARRWAGQVRHHFPGGDLYLDCAAFAAGEQPVDVSGMVGSCLRALQVGERWVPSTLFERVNLFRTLTADRAFLVVLENATEPAQILPLLPNAPGSVVLATSNADLGELRLDGARIHALGPLGTDASAALFERVCGPDRVNAEPEAFQHLVALCRGLPIAMLVLAAQLVTHQDLTLAALLDGLSDDGRRRSAGASTEGKLTVSAAFNDSYQRLPEPVQRLYRGIGTLPSIDITPAIAAILSEVSVEAAGRLLEDLASAQLAERFPGGRYGLHPLVRVHARECAAREPYDHRRLLIEQVIRHYLVRAAFADRALRGQRTRITDHALLLGQEQDPFAGDNRVDRAVEWLDAERANLVALVKAAYDDGHYTETWQLAEALTAYYPDYRYLAEWVTTSDLGARAAAGCGALAAEARLRSMLSRPYTDYGELEKARAELDVAQSLAERTDDEILQASVLEFRGRYLDKVDPEMALDAYRSAHDLNADAHEWRGVGLVIYFSGRSLSAIGRYVDALEAFGRALDMLRWLGDTRMASRVLIAIGETEALLDHPVQAEDALREAIATLDGRHYEAEAREILADLAERAGDRTAAVENLRRAVEIYASGGNPRASVLAEKLAR
jgi:tetratricopeptide (TPR) repeat protein